MALAEGLGAWPADRRHSRRRRGRLAGSRGGRFWCRQSARERCARRWRRLSRTLVCLARLRAGAARARKRSRPGRRPQLRPRLCFCGRPRLSGFSSDWLALREPADARARDPALAQRLAGWASCSGAARHCRSRQRHGRQSPLAGAAAGRGAALEPGRAGSVADRRRHGAHRTGCGLPLRRGRSGDGARDGVGAPVDLVTASALIDLCSAAWLQRLVGAVIEAEAALLIALTYDGRIALEPAHRA